MGRWKVRQRRRRQRRSIIPPAEAWVLYLSAMAAHYSRRSKDWDSVQVGSNLGSGLGLDNRTGPGVRLGIGYWV
ncbi:hypothetical protein ACFX2F_010228 [Malus domestica]